MIRKILIITIIGIVAIVADYTLSSGSNTISLITGNNGLYMLRPDEGSPAQHITINARVKTKGSDVSRSCDISINPYTSKNRSDNSRSESDDHESKMSKDELISFELGNIVSSINEDASLRRVILPSHLSSGERIEWSIKRKSHSVPIAFAVILINLLIYTSRNRKNRKATEAEQNSISRQLPEFINRLVLLLNAGLVLNSAFERSVDKAYGSYVSENDYFYGEMNEILNRVKQTNGSMNIEFREFARSRRSVGGDISKELMRISNIINDNISKGVELTEKLQCESELLWLNRKRNCEERGRIAETRLTLPLTLFLLVLIVITVSPALLEL